MRGRVIARRARQPIAPDTLLKAAMMRARERAWRNDRHSISQHFRGAQSPGEAPFSS
jgi:hypothetical protein